MLYKASGIVAAILAVISAALLWSCLGVTAAEVLFIGSASAFYCLYFSLWEFGETQVARYKSLDE